jgi:hypothetical protein
VKDPRHVPGQDAAHSAREKRLAEALRANLKRRKAAVRLKSPLPASEGGDNAPERAQDSNEDKR